MRVVVYLRVSTEEQDPQAQLKEIEKFCQEKGWEIVKIFEDKGVSGAIPPIQRPGFSDALSFCVKNGIGVIVAFDMTRFYRPSDPIQVFDEIKKIMEEHGIAIVFVKEPEIQDPYLKRLWEFIKAWFAGYERQQIIVRTRAGMAKLKEQGKLYHRPDLLWYYTAWLLGKKLSDLTKDDLERARPQFCAILEKYIMNKAIKRQAIPELLRQNEFYDLYKSFKNAPRTWKSIYLAWRKYCGGDTK